MINLKLKLFFSYDVTVISSNLERQEELPELLSLMINKIENKETISIDTYGGDGDKVYINLTNIEAVMLLSLENKRKYSDSDNYPQINILTASGRKIILHVHEDFDLDEIFLNSDSDIFVIWDYMDNPTIFRKSMINTILKLNSKKEYKNV